MIRKYFLIAPIALIFCCLYYSSCDKIERQPLASENGTFGGNNRETNLNNELMLDLVNTLRTKGCDCKLPNGTIVKMPPVGAVEWSDELSGLAKAYSYKMEANGHFEQVDSKGKNPKDRVIAAGYLSPIICKNISSGQRTETEVFNYWLNSQDGYCLGMMDNLVKEMGVARSNGNIYYWTQLFGGR